MSIMYDQIIKADSFTEISGITNAPSGQLAIDRSSLMTYQWNGTAWVPLGRPNVKKSTVVVNAKTVGATKILTLEPSPLSFYPVTVIPRASNISGVTTAPTVSLGSNATAYNNIATGSFLSTVLSALSAGNGAPTVAQYSPALPAATDIYANVTTGAIATNYSVSYDILGYYY